MAARTPSAVPAAEAAAAVVARPSLGGPAAAVAPDLQQVNTTDTSGRWLVVSLHLTPTMCAVEADSVEILHRLSERDRADS